MRRPALLLLLLLLPALAGCFGATGVALPVDRLTQLRGLLEEIDREGEEQVKLRLRSLQDALDEGAKTKDRGARSELARKRFLLGYCWERLQAFPDAQAAYAEAAGTEYGSVALFRTAEVAEYLANEAKSKIGDPDLSAEERGEAADLLKLQQSRAMKALDRASHFPLYTRALARTPPIASMPGGVWRLVDLRHEGYMRLDVYRREKTLYRTFEFLVKLCGGPDKKYSYVLIIPLLALLAKLLTTPLSASQFRSMRAMQALQPELKKLQQKYKDDKAQMARAQMELFKTHKVSPASSCLPLLIQMPLLLGVYYGIRDFIFRFEGVPFLYIKSLADPDVIPIGGMLWPGPLLLLYGVSMYFSQKLISTPAATPEQQQQQKLMSYLFPFMFVILLKSLPAAFILYWFLQNILMTGHQYLLLRPQRQAALPPTPGPPPAPGPPPEALPQAPQAGQSQKKKKKKRR